MTKIYTAFAGERFLASGSPAHVAVAVKAAIQDNATVLTFDSATAHVVDLDLRGSDDEITQRYADSDTAAPRGRGRPKLGVVPREITLLPRHWDWLSQQQGGASVVLRRLVDDARKAEGPKPNTKAAQEGAYRFMMAMAGDLPNLEDALRALFAGERAKFEALISNWPEDIAQFATRLAFRDGD